MKPATDGRRRTLLQILALMVFIAAWAIFAITLGERRLEDVGRRLAIAGIVGFAAGIYLFVSGWKADGTVPARLVPPRWRR